MGFFDDPTHWPQGRETWPRTAGATVQGKVTRLAVLLHRYRSGELALCVELDGDGVQRWCNSRLWRALGEARIDVGDTIKVTRGADEPSGGTMPASTWTVERLPAAPQQTTDWGAAPRATGPTW